MAETSAGDVEALLLVVVRLDCLLMTVLSLALLNEAATLPANCPAGDASAVACITAYLHSAHLTLTLKWIVAQYPVRLVVLPEAARNAAVALASLAHVCYAQDGGLTPSLALAIIARCATVTVFTPLLCSVCQHRLFTSAQMPAVLSASNGALGRAADALSRWSTAAAAAVLPEEVLSAPCLAGTGMGVLGSIFINGAFGRGAMDVCRRVNVVMAITFLVTA